MDYYSFSKMAIAMAVAKAMAMAMATAMAMAWPSWRIVWNVKIVHGQFLHEILGGKSWEPKLPLADNIIDPLTHINAQQGAINAQLTHINAHWRGD